MPDATVNTSIYPKASQNSLLDIYGGVAQLRNTLLQNQRQQVGLSQDKIDLVHKQFDGLMGMVTSMSQDPRIDTPVGPGIVQQQAQRAVDLGVVPADVMAKAMQSMPKDPSQISQWLRTNANIMLSNKERFDAIHGVPQWVNNGNRMIPVVVSPQTGVRQIGAAVPVETSPGERGAGVPGFDDQNRPTVTPMGTILQRAGYNPLTAMPETAPNQQANRLQPPDPSNPMPVPASNGSVPMGPPAGQIEAQTKAAGASADKYSSDAAAQTNYQQNIMPIQQAYEHVKALGPKGIGPGAEELNQAKSFLVTMGILSPDAQLSDFDQANKYLSAAMRSNGYTGSDAQLDAAAKASPTMKTSQGAALAVLQKTAAMARMQNAQVQAFQASGQGPETYSKWAAGWNAKQNAAAYAFDMMDSTQQLNYVKSLSKPELQKFRDSLGMAISLGLVTPPAGK